MRTSILLPQLLLTALVAANYQASVFPVGSDISVTTAPSVAGYDTTARMRLGNSARIIASEDSRTPKLQDHHADQFDDDNRTLAIRLSEPTTSPKTHTERDADLYSLHVPFYNEEGYMALFLSNETAVSFCKRVSKTLYEDSENVFVHLDLRLGNSTTEIPIREDSAFRFCQKIKKQEEDGDGGTTSQENGVESTTAGASENHKSILTTTGEVTSTEEKTESSEAQDEFSETAKPSTTGLQTPKSKSTVPPPIPTSDAEAPKLSPLVKPSPLPTSNPAPKTTSVATPHGSSAKAAATSSKDTGTDENDSPLDSDPLPSKLPSNTLLKVSESVKTPMTTASDSESLPLSDDDDLADGTTKKKDKLSVAVFPTQPSKEPTSRTAGPQITMSSINSRYNYINKYMYTAVPTIGAAVRARAVENAGVPRVGLGFWRRSQLLTRRRSGAGKKATAGDIDEATADIEDTELSPPRTSRVPAKPRPSPPQTIEQEPNLPSTSPTLLDESTSNTPTQPPHTRKPKFRPTASKAALRPSSIPALDTVAFEFPNTSSPPTHMSRPIHSPSFSSTSAASITAPPNPPNQNASEANIDLEPEADSSAWGKIQDPRMVWTMVVLWVIVVLQVGCGIWGFARNVRGKMCGDWVGRVGWWDENVRAAE